MTAAGLDRASISIFEVFKIPQQSKIQDAGAETLSRPAFAMYNLDKSPPKGHIVLTETDAPERSRVLVVDDDSTMRLLMTETLAEDGYTIAEVDNGPAAIDTISSFEPDMVLLDVKMPGMSGFEVCSEIRRLTGDTDISVVMVTGLDDPESIEKAFQLGATAFITKPINWDTFPYRIQYLLKARNAIVALKQRELHLEHTERISRILTQSKNKDTILHEVLNEMLDIFSANHAFIITARDKTYSEPNIASEALHDESSDTRNIHNMLLDGVAGDVLHRSDNSEYPIVSSYTPEPALSDREFQQQFHQIIMPLHVHNSHAWFITLYRCTNARSWTESEQETFYIIGLRLSGILSRYLLMEKLHQSENLLRQAQHVGHIGNWHWDNQRGALRWSDEMYHIYGYKPDSFVPTFDIFHQAVVEDDLDKYNQFRENVLSTGETQTVEHRIRLPNDEIRWVFHQVVSKLNADGNATEITGIVQDITDRIKKQAQETHNHKMEALGQLTSGVAHDFGNLMTIAKGNLELLNEEFEEQYQLSKDHQEILEDARSAIKDSVELTKQLLAFSRKKSLAQEYINVDTSINRFIKLFKNTLGDTIELNVDIQDNLPDILVDFAQFESSLLNVILNARNAMPDGGLITITAGLEIYQPDQDAQATDTDIQDQTVCITITDTGQGMTDEVRQHATEPFFTTRHNEGTGLGLSMVYGFMRQSRGVLSIDSSPGKGTCLKMLFPIYAGKRTSEAVSTGRKIMPVGDATVLVVEDRPEVRQFAVRCLDKLELNILEADNAASARSLLEKNKDIDVLFTDILMPGDMNGRDLANWAVKKFPRLKILLTTAAEKETQQQEQGSHTFQLLAKPYSKQDLLERIHDFF